MELVNVNLFGKRIFANIIKLMISSRDHPRLSRWALNPMTDVLIRDRRGEDRDTEEKAKREAEIGVMQPQAKERLESSETKRQGMILP